MKGFTLIPISSAVLALCVAGNAMAYTLTTQIRNMNSWSGQSTPAIIEACASDSHARGHKCGDYSSLPLVQITNDDLKGDTIEAGFRVNQDVVRGIIFKGTCGSFFMSSTAAHSGRNGLYEMGVVNDGHSNYNFMAQIQYNSNDRSLTMSHCVLETLNT